MEVLKRIPVLAAAGVTLLLFAATPAAAQLNSADSTATLTAVLPESLTVTLLPNTATSTLAAGRVTIGVTTAWTLSLTRTNLALYGYFSHAAAALVHTAITNTVDIPSSRVEVSVNGGAFAPFDQTVAFGAAAGGRQFYAQAITMLTASGSRADTLALKVNLAPHSPPLETYNGTLRIRAQVTP